MPIRIPPAHFLSFWLYQGVVGRSQGFSFTGRTGTIGLVPSEPSPFQVKQNSAAQTSAPRCWGQQAAQSIFLAPTPFCLHFWSLLSYPVHLIPQSPEQRGMGACWQHSDPAFTAELTSMKAWRKWKAKRKQKTNMAFPNPFLLPG